MSALPLLPEPANNAPEVVHVGLNIEFVATVKIEPCKCGSVRASDHPQMVKMARAGAELPPIMCDCGRILVAQRNRIIKPGDVQ